MNSHAIIHLRRPECILLAVVVLSVFSRAGAEDQNTSQWLQWRGPTRDGHVQVPSWPKDLSEASLQEQWRVELGPSYSGPIVTAEQVFVTETVDEEREVIRALDRHTGNELWKASWPGAMSVPFFAKANGDWIRSTPACDGERLYVAGMQDVLVCLDCASGKELWRQDLSALPSAGSESFGFVCSPLLEGDSVIVQSGAGTLRLNKLTGDIVWRQGDSGGGMMGGAFSSPTIGTLRGERQLLVQTRERLEGRNLETGEELWFVDVPAFRGMNILTPTVVGNRVFTSSYGGGSFMYEVDRSDSAWSVKTIWENKIEGYMSSPILHDNLIILHLRNQRVACLDVATGEEHWRSKPFGKYWSMIAQNGRLLALDEQGELILTEANPEDFRAIDRRQISTTPTWAHLAIAGNQLVIRELNAVVAFRWE